MFKAYIGHEFFLIWERKVQFAEPSLRLIFLFSFTGCHGAVHIWRTIREKRYENCGWNEFLEWSVWLPDGKEKKQTQKKKLKPHYTKLN